MKMNYGFAENPLNQLQEAENKEVKFTRLFSSNW
jgi:hypothetical protein